MSAPGQDSASERLDELESRMAFQDDTVERLNEVITQQDRLLSDLQLRLARLEQKMDDLADMAPAIGDGGGHEVPPHY